MGIGIGLELGVELGMELGIGLELQHAPQQQPSPAPHPTPPIHSQALSLRRALTAPPSPSRLLRTTPACATPPRTRSRASGGASVASAQGAVLRW